MSKLNPPIRGALRLDADDPVVQYVGESNIGTSESSPSWRIKRLTYTGSSISVEWADGNDEFDNVWANRASLSYS